MTNNKGKSKVISTILWIVFALLMVVLAFGVYLGMSTIKEWKPEKVEVAKSYQGKETLKTLPKVGDEYSILSFNIGYGSLGKESDFFLDGGKTSLPEDKAWTKKNLKGISNLLEKNKTNFVMLQEVDTDARRSSYIDEREVFNKTLKENASFAYNFRAAFIPYPIWNFTGRVNAGLYTASDYKMNKGQRIALPVPFKWPERIFNLKRCLLVNEINLEGTDKKLVLVNLHLEAYDKNGGRKAQTKQLFDLVKKEYEKGNYVIAGGDWNQALTTDGEMLKFPEDKKYWKPEVFKMPKEYKDAGWKMNYGTETSSSRLCNKPYKVGDKGNYFYIIDGFLTSPNIKVENVKTIDQQYEFTDHNPVELKFKLKE